MLRCSTPSTFHTLRMGTGNTQYRTSIQRSNRLMRGKVATQPTHSRFASWARKGKAFVNMTNAAQTSSPPNHRAQVSDGCACDSSQAPRRGMSSPWPCVGDLRLPIGLHVCAAGVSRGDHSSRSFTVAPGGLLVRRRMAMTIGARMCQWYEIHWQRRAALEWPDDDGRSFPCGYEPYS